MNPAFKRMGSNKFANEFKELPPRKIKMYQWFFQDKPEPLIILIISCGQKDTYHVISEDPFDTPNTYELLYKDVIFEKFGIKLEEQP